MAQVQIQEVSFQGWQKCLRMSNGIVELIIPLEIGPRILKYAFCDGNNVFYENSEDQGKIGGQAYRLYGGHRLWHAPQLGTRPNEPDNLPVKCEILDHNKIKLIQATEPVSRLQKQMEITLFEDTEVLITHTLTNMNVWSVPASVWALTMMCPGGVESIDWPEPQVTPHYPDVHMVFWPGFGPHDPRLEFQKGRLLLHHDPANTEGFKLGINNASGVARYQIGDVLFEKRFPYDPQALYPDMGVNYETFCNADFLEMESLSPLIQIEPNASVSHTERWQLFHTP